MIEITDQPIEVWKVLQSVLTAVAGGIVHFIGTVRQEGKLEGLFYECYPSMAQNVLRETAKAATQRWPIKEISIVHRYGWIEVGEPVVVIAVSAAHRREAFAACQFAIDRIKEVVPIWKRHVPEKEARLAHAS